MTTAGRAATDGEPVGEPDLASVAALFADAARMEMLKALLDGRALPASELAGAAGVTRSTASEHLDRLVTARVLEVRRQGRHAYFRLAGATAPAVMEALAALAPTRAPVSPRGRRRAADLAHARVCYDHLAGQVGVAVTIALRDRGLVRQLPGGDLDVDVDRWDEEAPLDVRCAALAGGRRPLVRSCLDWSERRYHLGGAIGAALTRRMFELDWLRRSPSQPRAVLVTPHGGAGLRQHLGVDVPSETQG